jgi:SAM-dependent methyltransferase
MSAVPARAEDEPTASRRAPAALLDAACAPYRTAGRLAMKFARGKLAGDPVFAALLRRGLVRDGALLDLGCGQGLLLAWLAAARDCHAAADWPAGWPRPPRLASYTGIDMDAAEIARAERALAARVPEVRLIAGDIHRSAFERADTIAILDVLQYLAPAAQDDVLARAHTALDPAGVLLLRVGDAAAGLRFHWTRFVDRGVALARGRGWCALHCRSLDEWRAALARLGFVIDQLPMSQGTSFANALLVCTRR